MDDDLQQSEEDESREMASAVEAAPPKFHELVRLVEYMPGTILALCEFHPSYGMWDFIFGCEWTADGMKSFEHLAGAAKRFPGWQFYQDRGKRFSEEIRVTGCGEFELASLVRSLRRRFNIKVSSTR